MSFIGELARLVILADGEAGGAAPAAGANPPAGGGGGILDFILGPMGMMVFLIALFWFMIIRPQQQREADHEKMLDELQVYDKVITIGGIFGTIVDIRKGEDLVTLRIDEKTGAEIKVLKSHISREESDQEEKKTKEKSEEKKDD